MSFRNLISSRNEIIKCNYFENRNLIDFIALMNSFEDGIRDNEAARYAFLFELSTCKNGNINYGFVIWLNEGIAVC